MPKFKQGDQVMPKGNVSHADEGTIKSRGEDHTDEMGTIEQYWVAFPNGDLEQYHSDNLVLLTRITQD